MTTCRDVIKSAYRRSGVMAAGVNLNASQANIGMERLIGLYQTLIEGGMFGRVCDKYIDTVTYTAEEGQRVYKSVASTVTIPPTVVDTGTGLTRQPLDLAFIIIVDPVSGEPEYWLFDRMRGQWAAIHDLTLTAQAPLTPRFDEQIKDLLAEALLEETGQPTPGELLRRVGRARMTLATRRVGERKTGTGIYS